MTEPTAPQETVDTPDAVTEPEDTTTPGDGTPSDAPEINWDSPDNPYFKRYQDAQAWGTQTAQELAEQRQILDLARQGDRDALNFLGWDPPEEQPEDLTTDEQLEQRLAALEADRQAQAQQVELEREAAEFDRAEQAFYETELKGLGLEGATEQYKSMVIGTAQNILDEDGLPDLSAAHKLIQDDFESKFKERLSAKRRSALPPSGASPSSNPDLDDQEQRREWLYAKAMEARDAEQGE